MRILKIISTLFILFLSFYLLRINLKLYDKAEFVHTENGTYNKDLYKQLQFLKRAEENGAGQSMQTIYPEGYVFYYALYGLTWCNFAKTLKSESPIKQEAIIEIKKAITAIDSDQGRAIFQANLNPAYGAFYQGWLNFLRGNYLLITADSQKNKGIETDFKIACEKISTAYQTHHTPYLYSYSYGCWPADNLFCIASLVLHDQLFESKYFDIRENWLSNIQTLLDKNGLIPHQVDLGFGRTKKAAQGSSQSLMNLVLPIVDEDFAATQFELYKQLFVDKRFGLIGIREYPKGQKGTAHIDSGPVILAIGGAASVVGMGTMIRNGNTTNAFALRGALEGFGWSYSNNIEKRFLFGQLPMADAFIAWSESHISKEDFTKNNFPKTRFHVISCILFVFSLLTLWTLYPLKIK